MPTIRVPNVISYYTEKQTQFEVAGSSALEAVQNAVEKFPALKFHVFDKDGNLRRQIYLFVNDFSVKELNGNETKVGEKDVVRILAGAAISRWNSTTMMWFQHILPVRSLKHIRRKWKQRRKSRVVLPDLA